MSFTDDEHHTLAPFFTNTTTNIFGLKLPQEVAGALFSRYSRSNKDLRRVFLDEFLGEFDTDANRQSTAGFALDKARAFYAKVLDGYGDDSIAQLGSAHIACEGISNLAALFLTDARIGIAPLEKSTRYVRFDVRNACGEWPYYTPYCYKDKDVAFPCAAYRKVMDLLFETYASQMEPVQAWLKEHIPQDDTPSGAYHASIRAKACDILRGYLPASTLTNVGVFGTGQAWEHLLTKGYSQELNEICDLSDDIHNELNEVIPSFVRRAGRNDYLIETRKNLKRYFAQYKNFPIRYPDAVGLVEYNTSAEEDVLDAIVYEFGDLSVPIDDEDEHQQLQLYIGNRRTRRDKPGRALEHAEYTFDFCANLGLYRDLHRHRMLTQERQPITTRNGYNVPKELDEMGLGDVFCCTLDEASELYEQIVKDFPNEAQYCVPFAYRQRWYMKMNLREALHICELRSMPQGHLDYRKIAQEMWRQITEVHPLFGKIQNFVDFNEYKLGRLAAEIKTGEKHNET